MQQIVPGIFHWTALNPSIGVRVSSYLVPDAGAIIDPMIPEQGIDSLPGRPDRILLSSGHHLRDSRRIAEALGIPIHASRQAIEHLGAEGEGIEAWEGAQAHPAPGVTALHVGVLAEDEGALHLDVGEGALVIADAVHPSPAGLAFFSDSLLGDDPAAVKQGLRAALGALADALAFDALLFAHGEPLATGGRDALRAFTARP
jgi:glyoxylase-like metal-dependent hydrolase (beta-lactamase superfamily II)